MTEALVGLAVGLTLTAWVDGRPWHFLLAYGGIAATGYGLVSQSVISTPFSNFVSIAASFRVCAPAGFDDLCASRDDEFGPTSPA